MNELSLVERYIKQVEAEMKGEKLPKDRITLKEALSTPDLSQFLQQTVIDVIKDTAEPMYIASKMLKRVQINEGRSIIFPAMSDIIAYEVPEMGNYRQETVDINLFESTTEVSVKKVGLIVRVSDEMVNDSQWDVKTAEIASVA
jgi:oligoribonuclease (3'-5' exoribonuclease)